MKKKFISTKMKILMLVLLILSITFYASGCITLIKSGYKLSDYADELHINPPNFKFNLNKLNLDFNSTYISKDYPLNDTINELDFNLNSQNIQVTNYDGDSLKVEIKSNNASSELTEEDNENKLTFKTKYNTPNNASILVSIPQKLKDKGILKITTSNGDVTFSNLSMNTITVFTTSGHINSSDLNLAYLSLNSASGNINFNNTIVSNESKLVSASGNINGIGNLGSLTANTSSGDIRFQIMDSINTTFISTNSGSVTLSIPKNLGYKINYHSVSGKLNPSNKQLSNGNESPIINVNTTSGYLNIK